MNNFFSRRKFITTTSLATAGTLLGSKLNGVFAQGNVLIQNGLPEDMQPWYDRTMRWLQIVLTEGDTGRYDPQWWFDLFKRANVQGICLVAGGMTAFYPSKVPFHPRAALMKDGDDMFGGIANGAKAMGITVVARTDAQACTKEAAAVHPEWLNIDENGNSRIHKSLPDQFLGTCAFGDYNFKHMTDIHKEIVQLYTVDGLFCNRWQGWARGMCYCNTCQALFKEFSGRDLPRKHADKTGIQKYDEWETARLTELWKLWDSEIQKINPEARYFSNVGLDIDRAAELAPTYMSETQQRGGNFPWHVGEQGKRTQAIFGPKKRIIALDGMTLSSRNSVAPEAEVRMWLLNAVTNGLSPWLIKSSATNWDNRWIPAVEKVYGWHHANEQYLRNEKNLSKVGMLFRKDGSRNPLLGTGAATVRGADKDIDPEGRKNYQDFPANDFMAAKGFYQALVEQRIPFDMAYNGHLNTPGIDRFKVLVLPNLANLTDEECASIKDYVKRGGSIVATYETSLYSEGKKRNNFALFELFGVNYEDSSESNGGNAYIRLEHQTKHPVLKGLEATQQVVSTANRANVKATGNAANPPLTRIPTFPTDPMEQIYPRIRQTDIPEVYFNTYGKGRVVYFPGDIDTSFAKGMAPDLALLLNNAVRWALNEALPAEVTGPGILEITCWQQKKSMTVHLFNCTNPYYLKSAFRENIPVGEQQAIIQIPEGKKTGKVRLLVAGKDAVFKTENNTVKVTVPGVNDHEAIAIDFV